MCGGKGYLVSTPKELARATEEGFKAGVPVVVNVIIESGKAQKLVRSNTVLKQTCLELAGRFRLVMLQI